MTIDDWIFHGFEDFEEFDLVSLLKTLKTSKLLPNENKATTKPKQANIRLKDYMINIESLQFSKNGRRLLVVYTDKDGGHTKFNSVRF